MVKLKVGEKIALAYVDVDDHPLVERRRVKAILPVREVKDGVAILSKIKPSIGGGCGARHAVRVEAPFYVRGGFRVVPVEMWKIKPNSLGLKFYRQRGNLHDEGIHMFPERKLYLADAEKEDLIEQERRKLKEGGFEILGFEDKSNKVVVFTRNFKVGRYLHDPEEPWADVLPPVAVYEVISENEVKLVDAETADYIALFLSHSVHSRSFTAKLIIDGAVRVDEKRTACAIDSVVVALAWLPTGRQVVINRNLPPYRGEGQRWAAEVWTMSLPPRLEKVLYVYEPLRSDTASSEEVV